ncbi:hypothetical protein RYA05_05465 [Pseudomonas syringae pv. actinidiae]|nr:hypothetical protein [Pseudomonas syringae pv. actinidiae]
MSEGKKRIAFSPLEKPLPRKYTLTAPTVYYLNFLMENAGKNSKEQTEMVCSCIDAYFVFSKKTAETHESFLAQSGLNLMQRGSGVELIWCKMPRDVLQRLDLMVDDVAAMYKFKSSSSLVNHAIAHVFENTEGAMAKYFSDEVTGKI